MSSIKESSLGLNYGWSYGETGWNSGMDENIVLTGFHANKQVKGILSTPPTTGVNNGDAYIVGSSPTGIWVGNYAKVAIYDRGSWLFATPSTGVSVYNKTNGCWYEYNNGWSLKPEAEESSYIKVKDFDFSTGYTITDSRQLLFYPTNQTYYQWNGALPKVVASSSTPTTSGGISSTAWVNRTDLTLREDLASSGGIRLTSACGSITDLLSLSSLIDNQRVDVLGFYENNLRGGGTFRFKSSVAKSSHNGITIISPTVPFDGNKTNTLNFLNGVGETDLSGNGCWIRNVKSSVINTASGGAVIDGVFDDSPICQRVHNLGLHVEYDSGSYYFNDGVTPLAGQRVFSSGVGFFNINNNRNVSIVNNNADGSIFKYVDDASTGQIDSPCIYGFRATADYPILMNNFTAYIADGPTGECPYLMKPYITNNVLVARQTGTGIGLHLSKAFDGDISGNDIYNFAINLSLLGCDLNTVNRNRVVGHTLYGILDRSANTFGSQNDVRMNDVLNGGVGAIHIKSTNRHSRIYNNYCEQPSGSIKGFIDQSSNGLPVWNPLNVDSAPMSIFIRDNRLDGHAFCTEFVYRLDADKVCPMTVIEDSSTTGAPASVDVLSIISSEGTKMLKLAIGGNNFNLPEYYFRGNFGRYSGFSTKHIANTMEINAENITKVLGSDIYGNGVNAYMRINGESICVLQGLAQPIFMYMPSLEGNANAYLADGVTYTCEILARTTSPIGDTLQAAKLIDGGGDPLNLFSLNQQWKKFTFSMTGGALTSRVGVYLVRGSQNGIIEIKSIKFY